MRRDGALPMEDVVTRQVVRMTAGKVLRSEEMIADEKEVAAEILRANPEFGNPHVVRCGFCHETRTLFRDESHAPFTRSGYGWLCEVCQIRAASQEVRF
jgi:hypothetical protein